MSRKSRSPRSSRDASSIPTASPFPGARVHLAARGASGAFDVDADPEGTALRRTATSEVDGTFTANVDGLGCAFDVSASASGFASAIVEDVALSGPPVEIRLGRGVTVTGTVRDLQENPVPGASITFRGLAGRGRLKTSAKADDAGRFAIGPLPPASTLTLGMAHRGDGPVVGEAHLFVEAEGFASQRVGIATSRIGDSAATESFDVHLARGGVVEGTVRAADGGAPVPGADVVVWTMEGMLGNRVEHGVLYRNPFGSRIVARGKTDDDGHYRIEHVPAPIGGIRILSSSSVRMNAARMRLGGVVAYRDGFAPSGDELGTPNSEGDTQTIDLVLRAAAVVTGRVVDQAGAPVAGARVFCTEARKNASGAGLPVGGLVPGEAGPLGGAVLSDDDGRFRHTSAPVSCAGAAAVSAYACGCDLGLANSPGQVVEVCAGSEVVLKDLVIERPSTLPIEGEVRDETGGPVAGARIDWGGSNKMNGGRSGAKPPLPVCSDHHGRFRILVPPAGGETDSRSPLARVMPKVDRVLTVSVRGRVTQVVEAPASGMRLVVTLRTASAIQGLAVRPDGTPTGGAEVRALPATLAGADSKALWTATPLATTHSDASGKFVIDGPEEAVVLVAFVLGEGMPLATAGPVTAPATDVRVTLPPIRSSQGLALRVRVVDAATGKLWLASMSGEATRSAAEGIAKFSGRAEARVDGPGLLTFGGMAPDTYDLRVESPGFTPWRLKGFVVDAQSTAQPLEARLGQKADPPSDGK